MGTASWALVAAGLLVVVVVVVMAIRIHLDYRRWRGEVIAWMQNPEDDGPPPRWIR